MSKALDTVQREKLLELLTARDVETSNAKLIKQVMENTALNVKSLEEPSKRR